MARRSAPGGQTPELSYIAEGLRPLAVPISSLVHDPHNAREHSEGNAAAIEGSLRRFGQRVPVVVNARLGNRVIAGNERLRIARDVLGWTHIAALPVVEDESSSVGYALADNRSPELAGWNQDKLNQALRLVEPSMNEQLDRMTVQLAEQMRLTMPAMEEAARRTHGGRANNQANTNNFVEPSGTGETIAMQAPPVSHGPQQKVLKFSGEEVPMTPDEDRALKTRLQEYRDRFSTSFGFVASLLEQSHGEPVQNGRRDVPASGTVQPQADQSGDAGAAGGESGHAGAGQAGRGNRRRNAAGRAPANAG